MDQLRFSTIGFAGAVLSSLERILERFSHPCIMHSTDWPTAWDDLNRTAYRRSGPDVSHIGSSWVCSLVDMRVLHAFADDEVQALGGAEAFIPTSWQTAYLPGRKEIWAIPWSTDTRVIYYWRDMLEQAGIDESEAFKSPRHIEDTMARLQASDVPTPWGGWAYAHPGGILQIAASWIWENGGDFISPDGRQILFNQPEALTGLLAYFGLHKYMPPNSKDVSSLTTPIMFTNRQIAVVVGASAWLNFIQTQNPDLDLDTLLGVAPLPGPAFVGGSNLVIWQRARHKKEAFDLVQFLIGRQAQADFFQATGFLPVRRDVLTEPPYTTHPHYQAMIQALETGRPYPAIPQWGAVEDRLSEALAWLWDSILADREQDLEPLIRPYMDSVARRLAVTLGIRK